MTYCDWPRMSAEEVATAIVRGRELHRLRGEVGLREKVRARRDAPELLDEVRGTLCGQRFGVRRVEVISYARGSDGIRVYPGFDQVELEAAPPEDAQPRELSADDALDAFRARWLDRPATIVALTAARAELAARYGDGPCPLLVREHAEVGVVRVFCRAEKGAWASGYVWTVEGVGALVSRLEAASGLPDSAVSA